MFVALPLWAATHYVASSGSATWANSTASGTPCSLATAFANAGSAGPDLVLLADGTYSVANATLSVTYDRRHRALRRA